MSGSMETGKPLISIVMAVYEPRLDWLREQLVSLNAQTYPNLELIIRDDNSTSIPYADICALTRETITRFPFKIERNEKNLGSNGTFECLTKEALGSYIAYCDQDDVWLPEKLETLQETIEKTGAELVCSDMYIIGKDGRQTADSIRNIRKHHVFHSGDGLAEKLLFSNFVTGCTMLVKAETAKAAAPFCPYMVHDHWLALFSSERGKIISLPDKLIRYRVHGLNQTDIMAGVKNRDDYFQIRILEYLERMNWLKAHFKCSETVKEKITGGIEWLEARKSNMASKKGAKTIWKYRAYSPLTSMFEIAAPFLNERMFMFIIKMKRKNLI